MKYLIWLFCMTFTYADNADLFNQAMQAGKGRHFNLNLNQNSTIDSYGKTNKFESSVANNANAGNVNSENMYNQSNVDPNYLYNSGVQAINDCTNKSDPRCSTLNKYGDKDTQTEFQAYKQNIASRFLILVKPDPSDSNCSLVTHKEAINQTIATCTSGIRLQTECSNIISPSSQTYECDDSKLECEKYKRMNNCSLVRAFIPSKCTQYTMHSYYGSCKVGTYSCNVPSIIHTPGCGGSHGRDYQCGTCISDGDQDGCWGQWCSQHSSPQLALYQCKYYSYSKGCSDVK